MKRRQIFLAGLAMVVIGCASVPPPAKGPEGEARYLIDPRMGWNRATTPAVERRFNDAWRFILAGDFINARKRLADVRERDAGYLPADLAEAAIDLREGRTGAARAIVDRVASRTRAYTSADVYAAEVDIAENQLRSAYDRYRAIVTRPDAPPTAGERVAELQTRLFEQLYRAATVAPDAESVRLLRDALAVSAAATAARVLLVQKLVALHQYEEARRELEPLLSTTEASRPEVQESLAEIDVGSGRYEEAIVRYERLARQNPSPRYTRRLEEVKEQFAAANMPPQFERALEAESITRGDLAVLMYWKVSSIRFAQNLATPPIAIDIGETPGRDEMIRAIALGIYQVDAVTRRVNPYTVVTGSALERLAARLLTLRGAVCARQVPPGGSEASRALAILGACGVTDPGFGEAADLPVSGRATAALLEQIDRAISR